jgi:hypothetical protein
MGSCLSKTSSLKLPPKALPPIPDAEALLYRVKLSKFRLRGVAGDISVALIVLFGDKEFVLPQHKRPYLWEETFDFEYVTSLDRMSSEDLAVTMDINGQEVASMSLQLLSAALGPVHQNFSMMNGPKELSRVSFDVEMLQVAELVVWTKQLKFRLNDSVANYYTAHFKLITDDKEERQIGTPSHHSSWEFTEEHQSALTALVTIDSVRHASIQLKLMRHSRHHNETLGECWTSFTKLFKEDQRHTLFKPESLVYSTSSNLLADLTPDTKHSKAFKEILWLSGRQVGEVSGLLEISGMPRVYQMLSGVNTENGLKVQASFILDTHATFKDSKKKTMPAEIIELTQHANTLVEMLTSQRSKQVLKSSSNRAVTHRRTVHEVKRLLSTTHRNTMTCFDYKKQKDLETAQEVMLSLADHLMEFAPVVMYDIQPYYFECLTLLLLRGELDLGYLTPLDALRRQKIAARYLYFLRHSLMLALKQLNIKGTDAKLQGFVDTMFVIAYFRLPTFKEKLLQCIKAKKLKPIPEWRDNVFDLLEEHESAVLLPVLDWENNFYLSLSDNSVDSAFVQALNEPRWQEKFANRGVTYFRFIQRFAQHVNRQFVRSDIPWHAIPGYRVILHSFLLELKQRPVTSYPEALVEASLSLLSYKYLISVLIRLCFLKTNIYDYLSVVETIGLVDIWLDRLFLQGSSFPQSFDHNFLIEGLLRVLNNEHAVSLAKVLLLVYRQLHMLSQPVREAIVYEYLIKQHFLRFMCHWSSEVRRVFMYVIEFRIIATDVFSLHDASESAKTRRRVLRLKARAVETDPADISEIGVYLRPALAELAKIEKQREVWAVSLHCKESGVYGGFESFPYPDLTINCLLVDKREAMLELD